MNQIFEIYAYIILNYIMKKLLFSLFVLISISAYSQEHYDIIVDRNGTGHFRTIQQAIDSVRAFNPAGSVITSYSIHYTKLYDG